MNVTGIHDKSSDLYFSKKYITSALTKKSIHLKGGVSTILGFQTKHIYSAIQAQEGEQGGRKERERLRQEESISIMRIKNEKGNGVDRKDKVQLLCLSHLLSYFATLMKYYMVRMGSFGVI